MTLPFFQSESEFMNSRRVCGPIVENLKNGNFTYDYNCECAQMSIKGEIQKERWKKVKTQFGNLSNQLSSSKLRSLTLAHKKGASNWLTALHLKSFGFALHKFSTPINSVVVTPLFTVKYQVPQEKYQPVLKLFLQMCA